jgi:hypothetical protein
MSVEKKGQSVFNTSEIERQRIIKNLKKPKVNKNLESIVFLNKIGLKTDIIQYISHLLVKEKSSTSSKSSSHIRDKNNANNFNKKKLIEYIKNNYRKIHQMKNNLSPLHPLYDDEEEFIKEENPIRLKLFNKIKKEINDIEELILPYDIKIISYDKKNKNNIGQKWLRRYYLDKLIKDIFNTRTLKDIEATGPENTTIFKLTKEDYKILNPLLNNKNMEIDYAYRKDFKNDETYYSEDEKKNKEMLKDEYYTKDLYNKFKKILRTWDKNKNNIYLLFLILILRHKNLIYLLEENILYYDKEFNRKTINKLKLKFMYLLQKYRVKDLESNSEMEMKDYKEKSDQFYEMATKKLNETFKKLQKRHQEK